MKSRYAKAEVNVEKISDALQQHQVRLLMDRDLLSLEEIYVHPCVNTATVALRTRDLMEVYFPFTGHTPQLLDIPDGEG